MQILTPSGYRDIADCNVGDEVAAFDMETGAPLVNTIETIQWVDAAEWVRWHTNADLPPFRFYRINGAWTLNSEQSIWRNGTWVCHAKHLVVGDVVYDDADHDVTITSIEEITADGWWRFDISGDHSYIVDGLTLHNASRFCRPGAGSANWTAVNTAIWAATTAGATGQTVPGAADTVTCDGNFGGGTCVLAFGGTITVQSITCGAMVGTLDNSVNNNDVTLSAAPGFSGSGSATRAIKVGTATYTLTNTTNNVTALTFQTTTGLTLTSGSETWDFSGAVAAGIGQVFQTGGLTFGTVKISGARFNSGLSITGGGIIGTLTNTAAAHVTIATTATTITTLTQSAQLTLVSAGATLTLTNAPTISGSQSAPCSILNGSTLATAATATISCASGTVSGTFVAIQGCTFQGGATFTFTKSFDLGKNSGATITAPSAVQYRPNMSGNV